MIRRDLLGVEIRTLGRLAIESTEGTLSLPYTLAMETGSGIILLTYSTGEGFISRPPANRLELSWSGVEVDDDESFDVAPIEDDQEIPKLPFRARSITTWIGVGPYIDLLAISLTDDSHRLNVTTTDDTLRCMGAKDAADVVESAAKNQNMQIIRTKIDQ